MLFFPFLAVLIWYFAGKYRRTWRGVLAVFLGMAVFGVLEITLIRAGAMGFAGMKPWLVVWLLIFSAVLVIVVAIFIFFMPTAPPPYVHCRKCRYNLTGLDAADLRCPECGHVWTRPSRCPHCRHSIAALPESAARCAECGAQVVPRALIDAPPRQPPPYQNGHPHGKRRRTRHIPRSPNA